MRYIDTGSRKSADTLGRWLETNVVDDLTLAQLRWQSGFFSADALVYFAPAMKRLRTSDDALSVLVGSNDGSTSLADMKALLAAAGPPRKNQKIGIVKFANAFFHPKTLHIVRADKSRAAYVGSANLTGSGLSGLHIEAGMLLDTREGDDLGILSQIEGAIDAWFMESRPGLNVVTTTHDLENLVKSGVLPLMPAIKAPAPLPKNPSGVPLLKPLVALPKTAKAATSVIATSPPSPPAVWSKTLSASDAQRKHSGNQRGSITLVQSGYPIDASSYFRNDFFKSSNWKVDLTNTGLQRETALVKFTVRVLGANLGIMQIPITHAANRESGQANYTSLLHIGPLTSHFQKTNLTGKLLELRRGAGGFTLSIQ